MPRAANEVWWAFTRPWTWLLGVGINLVLSLAWLMWQPVTHDAHRDWVVLVGTYFASFILADVTTTNVLGADAARVRVAMVHHQPIRRVLLAKNGAQPLARPGCAQRAACTHRPRDLDRRYLVAAVVVRHRGLRMR